ncbi:unnamed protein product [Leuciscus chuanchicus]
MGFYGGAVFSCVLSQPLDPKAYTWYGVRLQRGFQACSRITQRFHPVAQSAQRRPAELCSPTIISTMITCFNSTALIYSGLMTASGLLLANESVRGMFSGR